MCCLGPCCVFNGWRLLAGEPPAFVTWPESTPLEMTGIDRRRSGTMCCCMTLTGDAAVPIPARRVQDQGFSPPRLHCGTCDDCQYCTAASGMAAQQAERGANSCSSFSPPAPPRYIRYISHGLHRKLPSTTTTSGTQVRLFGNPPPRCCFSPSPSPETHTHTACPTLAFAQISHVVGHLGR